jgi:uncharacterized protein YvpB
MKNSCTILALSLLATACGGFDPDESSLVQVHSGSKREQQNGTGIRASQIPAQSDDGFSLTVSKSVRRNLQGYIQTAIELVGNYETGGKTYQAVTGNFDGQGLSYGVFQWNIGQGSLQPILRDMIAEGEDDLRAIFGGRYASVVALSKAPAGRAGVSLLRSHGVLSGSNIAPAWVAMLERLGATPKMQELQRRYADSVVKRALKEMELLGFVQVRSLLVLIQNAVQCGFTYSASSTDRESAAYRSWLKANASRTEKEKLTKLSELLIGAVNPQWASDVRSRIYTIINGSGSVHGIRYDIESLWKVSLSANAFVSAEDPRETLPVTRLFIASTDGEANVRGAADIAAEKLAVLANGTLLLSTRAEGAWLNISGYVVRKNQKGFGAEAWVHTSLLSCEATKASGVCVVKSGDGSANVRAADNSVSMVLKNGDMVSVDRVDGDWAELGFYAKGDAVETFAKEAWVHKNMASKTKVGGDEPQQPADGVVLKDVPYRTQLDNANEPGGTCGITSATMLLRYHGVDVEADDLYVAYGKATGKRPDSLASLYTKKLGNGYHTFKATWAEVRGFLDKGQPVVMHGWFTYSGHVVLAVGYDSKGLIFHDPYGRWLGSMGNYATAANAGKFVHYSYDLLNRKFSHPVGGYTNVFGDDGEIWISTAK